MNLGPVRQPAGKREDPRGLFDRLFGRQVSVLRRSVFVVGVVIAVALLASDAVARVGGGQSYSGGGGGRGGSSGGGGDGGGAAWVLVRILFELTFRYPAIGLPIDIIIIAGVIYWFSHAPDHELELSSSTRLRAADRAATAEQQQGIERAFDQLRRFDPNFSEIIFTDFCYALYGRAHQARGHGAETLDLLSPYLSEQSRTSLLQLNSPDLKTVEGIIVGEVRIVGVSGLDTPTVGIRLLFEANYTEVGGGREMSYYVREGWELERKRDVLSSTPQRATALHCPRCGAELQKDTSGACKFCGAKIESGEFQWYVVRIAPLGREGKGPLLTADVPEEGTLDPTITQPNFEAIRAAFEQSNPWFAWPEFEARARLIFNELQAAWSSLQWERARPHETENIFQMHRYWIDAYLRSGLRNVLDNCQITSMEPVKIQADAFYNAVTLRIFAEGNDYTVDKTGRVVSGSNTKLRRWSEYWTFIRYRKAKPAAARDDLNCPNCGAPLKVNAAGICDFCGGKITSGEFDWVLSKIEQDESYAG
jgi:inner membrane protein import complex subunit Tim44-like protein